MNFIKKLFNNYYHNIKDNFEVEQKVLLGNGLLIVIVTLLTLIFNFNKISTLTILYLFPISMIIISVLDLYYASKTKEKKLRNWIISNISAIIYLLMTLFFVFNRIADKYAFIFVLGIVIILVNGFKYLKHEKHSLLQYLNIAILIIIGIISIIFNKYIIDNYYLYYIILFMIYGIKKIIYYFIFNKINKK